MATAKPLLFLPITLGCRASDKVTGFVGIVTCRTEYLNGCVRYAVTPPIDKDGKVPEIQYLDEGQLEYVDAGVKKAIVPKATGGDRPAPRGMEAPR